MTRQTYAEKLRDPRWQKKRLEILQRDGWRCCNCDSENQQLHVHHKYYISGRNPWEYPDFCYATLCANCHKTVPDIPPGDFFGWEELLNALMRGGNVHGSFPFLVRMAEEIRSETGCSQEDFSFAVFWVAKENKSAVKSMADFSLETAKAAESEGEPE